MKTDLRKYIKPETVCIYSENVTKPLILQKIAELCESVINEPHINSTTVYQYLQNREFLGSTGLQDGIALPHCKIPTLPDFIIGVLISPDGVAFGSIDGKLSKLFFFVVAPDNKDNEFLNIMSEIGQFLSNKGNVEKLCTAKTNAELYSILMELLDKLLSNSD